MTGLKHQAAAARKWRSAIRQVERHFPSYLPPALFLTDPKRTPDPASLVERLPESVGVVYRHFGAADRQMTAQKLARACAQSERCFLIAADPELALAVSADGVHWPEATASSASKWLGKFALQTGSAHSPAAIRAADKAGLDAVLVSTVFASKSASASAPLGLSRFRTWTGNARLPVYALGGVGAENAQSVAGFAGLAAIEGFLR
nr:thiamine phosphate synthase [Hyphomonas sp. Mor2]